MSRHAQTLTALLFTALAVVAILAPAAHAAPKYTPAQYPATMEGSQVGSEAVKFAIGTNFSFVCEQMGFEGNIASKAEAEGSAFNASMGFALCRGTLLGNIVPFTIAMNGCSFTFSLQEEASGSIKAEGWQYTGGLGIACPGTAKIVLSVYQNQKGHSEGSPMCTYTIASQGPVASVDYQLDEAGTVLTAKPTISAVAVTKTSGTLFNCGKAENTMSVTGAIVFEAFNGKGEMLTGAFDAS